MHNFIHPKTLLWVLLPIISITAYSFLPTNPTEKEPEYVATLADGYWNIASPANSRFLMANGAGVSAEPYEAENTSGQQWQLDNGYIRSRANGKYLTANRNGAVFLSDYRRGDDGQQWRVENTNGGQTIRSVLLNAYLQFSWTDVTLSRQRYDWQITRPWPTKTIRVYAKGDSDLMKKVGVLLSNNIGGMHVSLNGRFDGNYAHFEVPFSPSNSWSWTLRVSESAGKQDCGGCYESESWAVYIDANTNIVRFEEEVKK